MYTAIANGFWGRDENGEPSELFDVAVRVPDEGVETEILDEWLLDAYQHECYERGLEPRDCYVLEDVVYSRDAVEFQYAT